MRKNNLNCRAREIVIPSYDSSDRKKFCQERAKAYIHMYAPDMESLTGLWIIFESYRLPEEEQIRDLREIRRGNYPREKDAIIKNK